MSVKKLLLTVSAYYRTSCFQTDVRRRGYEVVAINDLTKPQCSLSLKHDTAQAVTVR